MRSDVHTVFDARKFAITPKNGHWVVHVFAGDVRGELASLYHNVQLDGLSGLALENIFARFAWTILGFHTIFLSIGIDRRLVIVDAEGKSKTADVSGHQCRFLYAAQLLGSKSRSQSPTKRQRDESSSSNTRAAEEGDESGFRKADCNSDDVGTDRGRSKRMKWCSSSAESCFEPCYGVNEVVSSAVDQLVCKE